MKGQRLQDCSNDRAKAGDNKRVTVKVGLTDENDQHSKVTSGQMVTSCWRQ